jgi:hypothetical protein
MELSKLWEDDPTPLADLLKSAGTTFDKEHTINQSEEE